MSLTACNDYLDVDAPSAYTEEYVYGQESEIERALNGVYAKALVSNLYGNAYQYTFQLNSDVDIQISSSSTHSHTTYARLDCDDQGSGIYNFWNAAYTLVEYANLFIASTERSELYDTENTNIMQMLGEAKCLRAMAYHDLVVMFGDVPFSFESTADRGLDEVMPVTDRQIVQDSLINDLISIAPYMQPASSVTVEHCSKEFAQAMIARIALTAGGYSLRPDKSSATSYGYMARPDNYLDYYTIARAYADSVITAGGHSLKKSYMDVFIDECNYIVTNDDDPIFEIPFAKESTGNTGYLQGPSYSANDGVTVGAWGATSASVRTNAFYRFSFRDDDMRREYVNGMWYYTNTTDASNNRIDSITIRNDYSVHNNKWSKLWTSSASALGNTTEGSTGINFPYMRYADVLLMYAETDNELNGGPTDKAIECLAQVHNRAFVDGVDGTYIEEVSTDKETFQEAVLNERKWEFAGENMRWRDLVRTNKYAEELVYSFLRYYAVGLNNATGSMDIYGDLIVEHDGSNYINTLPSRVYYHPYTIDEPSAVFKVLPSTAAQLYGYVLDGGSVLYSYPNQELKSMRIYNPYTRVTSAPTTGLITRYGFSANAWNNATFYSWGDEDTGTPKDQCKYSFYGYIRSDDNGNIWLINNGAQTMFPGTVDPDQLPVVRYLLPYPNQVIQRAGGEYVNYYGY